MTDIPPGVRIEGIIEDNIDPVDYRSIIAMAARYHMKLWLVDYKVPTREEVLQTYFKETAITSPENFVGKEHFKRAGQKHGISLQMAQAPFNALVFPIAIKGSWRYGREDSENFAPITPENLGLIVRPRADIEFPYPPDFYASRRVAPSTHAQLYQRMHSLAELPDDLDYVIQVGSFLHFVANINAYGPLKLLRGKAIDTLVTITEDFTVQIEANRGSAD